MLGRLIQSAASYGRGNTALESATEEAHTRNLLYGQSQNAYLLAQSPPPTPYGGSAFRPGSYDDRGGLELEEKDVRILIAQDAFGAEEKPSVLYDSNVPDYPTASHSRHASTAQIGQRSPLPNDWRPGFAQTQANVPAEMPFRNRSSTISNASSAWTRPVRDTGTREEAFLECMFGVVSSTKASSTIKMHIVPGKPKMTSPGAGRGTIAQDTGDPTHQRIPLVRSRTSNMVPRSQTYPAGGIDNDTSSLDVVLITRLFHVALAEAVTDQNATQMSSEQNTTPAISAASPSESGQSPKKPKLVERKVPAFAVGLILYLPRATDSRWSSTRPGSRSSQNYALSSPPNFHGGELYGPWSFVNAIPDLQLSHGVSGDETDRRIDIVVNNWDAILRAIYLLEQEATVVLREQLEKNLSQMTGAPPKTPKEKSMQRVNQRIVSITDPTAIARRVSLQRASKHALRRVSYALRVPRVVTGLGFAAGHWSDEARHLYRLCGRRQQNFFLFNLLTAFLGLHTQWLSRLAPDWYRKQFRLGNKTRPEPRLVMERTIIVSDQRAIARQLIFVLASFLPGLSGGDGLHRTGDDLLTTGQLSTSSPSSHMTRSESLRRTANRRMRDHRLQSNANERAVLSTSASSTDSTTPYLSRDKTSRYLVRRDSDAVSVKGLPTMSVLESESQSRKASLVTASTMTPNPATPVAYFSTRQDSYFPEGALADTQESVASADLAKILRRSSSSAGNTSNVSSRWGSLVSGISDLLGTRYPHSAGISSGFPSSPLDAQTDKRNPQNSESRLDTRNPLQDMVDELDAHSSETQASSSGADPSGGSQFSETVRNPLQNLVAAPRLKVDDKDGVIDVDLDLPGFSGFSIENLITSPSKRSHRTSTASYLDGAESIKSLRSIPTLSPKAPVANEIDVAGFLRSHHQDFALHAVRPYAELDDEIKQSMSMERSPVSATNDPARSSLEDEWTNVCTTLIADVRTFSIRRITLRRKIRGLTNDDAGQTTSEDLPTRTRPRTPVNNRPEQIFVEEDIKDFDTMLADAVERVLNLTEALQPQAQAQAAAKSPKMGHSRSTSTSTTMTSRSAMSRNAASTLPAISQEYVRQDCRQVVLGALEEVVKDVVEELSKLQKGRSIGDARGFDGIMGASGNPGLRTPSSLQPEAKQENILREGIKRWLLDVERVRV